MVLSIVARRERARWRRPLDNVHASSIGITVDHRICDSPLGNYTNDILHPRAIHAVEDDGGAGAMTSQSSKDQA